MFQRCWKCQGRFDTRDVDTSVTVGLCPSCYAKFDAPERVPSAVAAPHAAEVLQSSLGGGGGSNEGSHPEPERVVGMDHGTGVDGTAFVLLVTVEYEDPTEALRQQIWDVLQVPSSPPEYGTGAGRDTGHLLDSLQQAIVKEVQRIKDDFLGGPIDVEHLKRELRRASVDILLKHSGPSVPMEVVERLVDEVIEKEFQGVVDARMKALPSVTAG